MAWLLFEDMSYSTADHAEPEKAYLDCWRRAQCLTLDRYFERGRNQLSAHLRRRGEPELK